jgi:hypothetical protein
VYVVLAPWAAVAFAASEISLFWFVLGEIVPLVFLALVLQRGGIVPDWWRTMPSLREVGWSLITAVVLTAGAVVIYSVSGWWRVLLATVAGAANAWLWRCLVSAAVRTRPRRWFVPAGPIAVVISALALLGMGHFSTIGDAFAKRPPPTFDRFLDLHPELLYVTGYNSALDSGEFPSRSSPVYHYSYRVRRAVAPAARHSTHGTTDRRRPHTASAAVAGRERVPHGDHGREPSAPGPAPGDRLAAGIAARWELADDPGDTASATTCPGSPPTAYPHTGSDTPPSPGSNATSATASPAPTPATPTPPDQPPPPTSKPTSKKSPPHYPQ